MSNNESDAMGCAVFFGSMLGIIAAFVLIWALCAVAYERFQEQKKIRIQELSTNRSK